MRRTMLFQGVFLVAAGMAVIVGGAGVSGDWGVAIGWLIALPLVVSIGGCAIMFVSLAAGWSGRASRFRAMRVIALVAIVGLAAGLAFPLAGIISQIPDTVTGSNGEFVQGAAPAIGVFMFAGAGLAGGTLVGALVSLLARSAIRHPRYLEPTAH
ncbi:hypothetical protein OHB93_09740 [Microbacterium sp. No. 7]|uniref:hypothetical protein n=1 Tax=Microbacterium sp. No. 7 TaxID=1714373 RepID=UPI00300892BE